MDDRCSLDYAIFTKQKIIEKTKFLLRPEQQQKKSQTLNKNWTRQMCYLWQLKFRFTDIE